MVCGAGYLSVVEYNGAVMIAGEIVMTMVSFSVVRRSAASDFFSHA